MEATDFNFNQKSFFFLFKSFRVRSNWWECPHFTKIMAYSLSRFANNSPYTYLSVHKVFLPKDFPAKKILRGCKLTYWNFIWGQTQMRSAKMLGGQSVAPKGHLFCACPPPECFWHRLNCALKEPFASKVKFSSEFHFDSKLYFLQNVNFASKCTLHLKHTFQEKCQLEKPARYSSWTNHLEGSF